MSQKPSWIIQKKQVIAFIVYVMIVSIFLIELPDRLRTVDDYFYAIVGFGTLGVWRYSWWCVHLVRSIIYREWVFPTRRKRADALWARGNRPKRLWVMMTTFREEKSTTAKVMQSIFQEGMTLHVPILLYVGIGDDMDEDNLRSCLHQKPNDLNLTQKCVRQKQPGKRHAISETLRAMLQDGLSADDLVIFMDGDTYFEPGCLQKCLPFFALYPNMQALTTNESAKIMNGPTWFHKWIMMRFAQRDFTMQSYALSDKVLTLTGRMSIFRGKHLCEPGFIDILENDQLTHWLWGKYRFLSGDDKSTWYYLLKNRADMFYIPDAMTVTIETIQGSPLARMRENLRRWSGNTLRNGARAIALGPSRTGYFIWWCLIDQRLAIWTTFIGQATTLVLAFAKSWWFILVGALWVALSRLATSMILFYHAKRLEMSFPLFIYLNQLFGTLIKIYILFRLPQQRWTNRGDQQLGFQVSRKARVREWVALYLTGFYVSLSVGFVIIYLGVWHLPDMADFQAFLA